MSDTTQKMKSVFSIYDYRQTVDSIFSSVSLHTSNLGGSILSRAVYYIEINI